MNQDQSTHPDSSLENHEPINGGESREPSLSEDFAEASSANQTATDEQRLRELEDLKTMLLIKDLESKVKSYESKTGEIRDYVKKMEAEIEQIRARSAREVQKAFDLKQAEFLRALLSISDNFDRSLESIASDSSPLAEGFRLIRSQFENFFQSVGLVRSSSKGEVFNPHLHEAIATQPTPMKTMDQVVVHEVKAGYQLNGAVLRPAQVVVANYQSSDDRESASES